MAIELIDRKESASYKGSIYELTLLWDRESIRKSFCGMPPFFSHIRKDGANFATIDCYSNDNGRFAVKKFMPSLLANAVFTRKAGLAGAFRQGHQHHTAFGTAGRSADLICMDLSNKSKEI